MNDEDNNPFEAVTDEVAEARIVAWVLGEASAFEIAELERMCRERPELEFFRKRMLALHGLLEEVGAEEMEAGWKLPYHKLRNLNDALGVAAAVPLTNPVLKKRGSRKWLQGAIGIAACLISALVVWRLYHVDEKGKFGALGTNAMNLTAPVDREAKLREEWRKAIMDQEDKVEERRKALANIVREKQIIFRGDESIFGNEAKPRSETAGRDVDGLKDGKRSESIKRGIDTQDYVDAKRELESDIELLSAMKLKGVSESVPGQMAAVPRTAPVPEAIADVSGIMTGGLRSGDQEVSRKSIDAILNNPDPAPGAGAGSDFESMAALPSAKSLTESAQRPRARPDEWPRTLPAITSAQSDAVRRGIHAAEGNFNLGKYDDAKKEYEGVLRADPANSAARRGLERLAAAKSDYYRAAYDHTRSELLVEVDKAWELPASKDSPGPAADPFADPGRPASPKEPEPGTDFRSSLGSEGMGIGMGMGKGDSLLESLAPPSAPGFDSDYVEATDKPLLPEMGTASLIRPLYFFDGRENPSLKEEKSLDLGEINTAEESFSTFSLDVSDVSFQLAKAELEKGGQPDPASIKIEQFYNAIDYGDPAPSDGEPVAGVVEQSAHPVIPGRNLVRLAVRTGATGRSAAQPLRLTLLIDQSGSMVRDDRKAAMDKAMEGLGRLLTAADRVTVIGFSRTPRLITEALPGDRMADLDSLLNAEASEGGTNLEEAMKLAENLALRHKLAGAQNRVVLFTDGAANLGDADPVRLEERVKNLRHKGIAFDVAGIGADGLNDRLLAGLARNGNGRYYIAAENFAAQLAGAFRPAAEDVKVQVKFNPERVSRYKLIGFEENRLKTEDFRNDAVDAAELAAEESAVALYQVELIAGGSGGIGEMSVRFREAGSGEMVERSWTIAHEETTPAFDKAPPSMQLAGLAMLAGEKLKGGPLADAIDFKTLAGPIAAASNYYAGSSRAADMIRVVRLLSK